MSTYDEVFCAKSGRRITCDGNVVYLSPAGYSKPVPADMPDMDAETRCYAESITIRSVLGGMTVDEAIARAAIAEWAALAARYDDLPEPGEDI